MDNKTTKLFNLLRVLARKSIILKPLYAVYCRILGVEIPCRTQIGEDFTLYHGGRGSVVNPYSVIGNHVTLRHNTTLGSKGLHLDTRCPIIEDYVNIGPNVCIIGEITVGHHSIIGAGAVVVKDVPPYSIVAGNPAKVVRLLNIDNFFLGGGQNSL